MPNVQAQQNNEALAKSIRRRASKPDAVLGPCLNSYDKRLADESDDRHALLDLTSHLTSTLDETRQSIRRRMEAKWAGDPEAVRRVESSVTNSLRRSAGTNYQSLVSYGLARCLAEKKSEWYVAHPVPKDLALELSILFTAGIEPAAEDSDDKAGDDDNENGDVDEAPAGVTVKPDVDILLRNASWDGSSGVSEPMLILSVKTSLADRAGSAARWKTYFDLVTRPCPRACEDDCAYSRLGLQLARDPNVALTHGIVTANIYKIDSDERFRTKGELHSNQARANTFMFDLRYTTRNENEKVMAKGWNPLPDLIAWLATESKRHGLSA